MRKFEKISFEQFKKDVRDDLALYNDLITPKRSTKYSAGYDFVLIDDIKIEPNEVVKIPTGIKVCMNNDEVLFIMVRSSIGFKQNVRITNQVVVTDSDYYNNHTNEGHLYISLQNHSLETKMFKKGEKFVQGVFTKYLTTDDEEEIENERIGGIGSTNKEETK